MTQRQRFIRGEQPTATRVQEGRCLPPSRTDVIDIVRASGVAMAHRARHAKFHHNADERDFLPANYPPFPEVVPPPNPRPCRRDMLETCVRGNPVSVSAVADRAPNITHQ